MFIVSTSVTTMLSTFENYKTQTELKLNKSSDILKDINAKFNLAQVSSLKDDLDKHSKIMEELNTKWTIFRNYIELISDQTSINHLFKMLETQVKPDDRLNLENSFLKSVIADKRKSYKNKLTVSLPFKYRLMYFS